MTFPRWGCKFMGENVENHSLTWYIEFKLIKKEGIAVSKLRKVFGYVLVTGTFWFLARFIPALIGQQAPNVAVLSMFAFIIMLPIGWAAAKAKISRSGNKIMVPPATVDGAAVEGYEVTVLQGNINSSMVTSSLYALSASASAYINGTSVATDSTSRNLSV